MRIAILLEDYRLDQYIVKSVIEKLARFINLKINYRIIMTPMVTGIDSMSSTENLQEICRRYGPMSDIILIIHDRDGRQDRDRLAESIRTRVGTCNDKFKVIAAHQEIEVWGLAGVSDLPKEWNWQDIRQEQSAKEIYFESYIKLHSMDNTAGKGRYGISKNISYKRLRDLCPEIIQMEEIIKSHAG
ncbi:hypothetical protein [Deinococcus wulumuqiensis]|uniref:hypothetical protein n=1 Tax=Deinococcus wulumuqiensis TaxID=980427 RepID=UPI0013C30D44|nr:hypothetical protein [Deinococcus wulumuqiensis]